MEYMTSSSTGKLLTAPVTASTDAAQSVKVAFPKSARLVTRDPPKPVVDGLSTIHSADNWLEAYVTFV